MTENTDVSFSKLAVTRISHDLAGVISAVSNSLSLLDDFGGADAETLKLAVSNADILTARLKFFRAAFGIEGPLTGAAATRVILTDYLATLENRATRFACEWNVADELPIFMFRLILLGGQIAAESLMRGGNVRVTANAGEKTIEFYATGKTAEVDPSVAAVLENKAAGDTAKTVTAGFLRLCLNEVNWTAEIRCEDNAFLLRLTAVK